MSWRQSHAFALRLHASAAPPRVGLTQALGAMTASHGQENPYQAPQASASQPNAIGSPWRRFWLGCLGWVLPVPAAALVLLRFLPNQMLMLVGLAGLFVLLMATIAWVVRACHKTGLVFRATVAVGLAISLTFCFAVGSRLLVAPIFNKPIKVTLPQRGT